MLLDLKRTKNLMEDVGIDALVASSSVHVFYTSDLPCVMSMPNRIMFSVMSRHPWAFSVIHRTDEPVLICANSAAESAQAASWIRNIVTYKTGSIVERPRDRQIRPFDTTMVGALTRSLEGMKATDGNIGIEKTRASASLSRALREALPKATLGRADELFMELRSIKSDEEIKRIKRATEITERAIQSTMETIEEGMLESELLSKLKASIFEEGGDWLHTTIGAGKLNSAEIYHAPSAYKIRKGDVIRFDVGAVYDGYASDLARVAVVGKMSQKIRRLYKALLSAQSEVVSHVKPGAMPSHLFHLGQQTVRASGYPNYSRGMIGHGIGLEVEETPMISPSNNQPLVAGMVLAIEVPRYISGFGGFNIEDILLVTEDGHEILSTINREIFVCD